MDRLSTHGSMIEQIDLQKVPRSGFDKSHHNFLTGRLGAIIPTRVKEVLPGDRIKGSTHIVTNFEPLASPIMASMVQKEETFFVPYSVIWDKAHRFFTGKKGFNDPMPSKSLKEIYASLASTGCLFVQKWYENFLLTKQTNPDDATVTDGILYVDAEKMIADIAFIASWCKVSGFVSQYEVVDLFRPLQKICEDCINRLQAYLDAGVNVSAGKNITLASISTKTTFQAGTYTQIPDAVTLIARVHADLVNFFFGPSSVLDYMGVCGFDSYEYILPFYDVSKGTLSQWLDSPDYTAHPISGDPIADLQSEIKLQWLPLRALYWIWYWNYRDELIELAALDPEEEMYSSTISNAEIALCLVLRQRAWFKDTFTTALTNTGDGNVNIPVTGIAGPGSTVDFLSQPAIKIIGDEPTTSDADESYTSGDSITQISIGGLTYQVPSRYMSQGRDSADSFTDSSTSWLSLDLFDRAKRLSSWISKRLVLGTEYDDVVYSSFMVKLSNVRMRVPELLGAGRSEVNLNVVVNNTTTAEQPAASKTAVAFANNMDNLSEVNYYAEEHGLLLSIMSIMPIQSYPDGIQRLYLRQNRFDFAWPEFAQLGMDGVYNCELTGFRTGQDSTNMAIFGYQGRYYDYKSDMDEEHGRMKTDLNYLTFGRTWDYGASPRLNYEFVHCWPRTDMFVVDDGISDLFRSDIHFRYAFERALPVPSDVLR